MMPSSQQHLSTKLPGPRLRSGSARPQWTCILPLRPLLNWEQLWGCDEPHASWTCVDLSVMVTAVAPPLAVSRSSLFWSSERRVTLSGGGPAESAGPFLFTDMETENKTPTAEAVEMSHSDLSEQIKVVTRDSHLRAENTPLMLSYQKGHVTLEQYKLLLCSLQHIYEALEDVLEENSSHPGVAPIYFPAELARRELLEADLEYFYGQDWRQKVVVPKATERYAHRLRQIGRENPEFLVAHAYTRYLGDLSGGQMIGRITQKCLGLKNGKGMGFFSFPNVSNHNLFKQLYRSRMNSVELTEEQRTGMLEEAVLSFELNIQVFNGLQDIVSSMQKEADPQTHTSQEKLLNGTQQLTDTLQISSDLITSAPLFKMLLGLCVALATPGVSLQVVRAASTGSMQEGQVKERMSQRSMQSTW
ncbi:Heme oxygenase [Merluccius polli]|uniref:heme oxygenase (biliverdin-producing) n=1 Tax=Merluccius polli TaxID=89951 RepID=A0AA47MY27_MERPO|nr:Heme oxygenase [Merluccius polli]